MATYFYIVFAFGVYLELASISSSMKKIAMALDKKNKDDEIRFNISKK